MMRSILQCLALVWLGLAAPVHAQIPGERVDQYIALSGIGEMLDAMPGQIETLIAQLSLSSEQPELERELKRSLAGTWNPAAARDAVEAYLQAASDAQEIDRLLEWKVSPLAKKMMAAEMASYAPDFREGFSRHVESLPANPPDEATQVAISRLVAQAHVANLMVESTVQVTKAVTLAFIEAGVIDDEEAVAEFTANLGEMRKQLRPRMEQQAVLLSHYIYRGMTRDEIDRYADFYATDLGRRELALAYGSLEAVMAQWTKASVRALATGPEKP